MRTSIPGSASSTTARRALQQRPVPFQRGATDVREPDTLTPKLNIDDKALKDILKRLYFPDSPYEFSVLPAEILGQVYEQFLGKVIRLTPAHRAVVEDKPEVKKAGGVYYTPRYIVDYIVEHYGRGAAEGQDAPRRGRHRTARPAPARAGPGVRLRLLPDRRLPAAA